MLCLSRLNFSLLERSFLLHQNWRLVTKYQSGLLEKEDSIVKGGVGVNIECLRSDCGGEPKSNVFNTICEVNDIKR